MTVSKIQADRNCRDRCKYLTSEQKKDMLEELKAEMKRAAKDLEFERAAELRNEIEKLEGKRS